MFLFFSFQLYITAVIAAKVEQRNCSDEFFIGVTRRRTGRSSLYGLSKCSCRLKFISHENSMHITLRAGLSQGPCVTITKK